MAKSGIKNKTMPVNTICYTTRRIVYSKVPPFAFVAFLPCNSSRSRHRTAFLQFPGWFANHQQTGACLRVAPTTT